MYFCVKEFEVGINDSIFSGDEQQNVYILYLLVNVCFIFGTFWCYSFFIFLSLDVSLTEHCIIVET